MKKFDTLVYIGRFQPFHNSHLQTIEIASKLAEKVLVIVGSSFAPRTVKNPFTYFERYNMIFNSVEHSTEFDRTCELIIAGCEDVVYDDGKWVKNIKDKVASHANKNIGIIGHNKDDSSFYLNLFNEWEFYPIERLSNINATDIRNIFLDIRNIRQHRGKNWFGSVDHEFLTSNLPKPVYEAIEYFINGKYNTIPKDDYENLKNLFIFIEDFKDNHYNQPLFLTSHFLIISGDSVLLQKNSLHECYHDNLFMLPGDWLIADKDKSIVHASVRHLSNYFGKNFEKLLKKFDSHAVFDKINRSELGRFIAHIHKIEISPEQMVEFTFPIDNHLNFKWVKVDDLERELFFEDFYDIIIKMIEI